MKPHFFGLPQGILLSVWLAALPGMAQPATAPTTSERILQQELKQQQIQRTTARVGEQLAGIIEEFERNAITGEDVRVLKAIRFVLGHLSEKEMGQVVSLLQQARESADPTGARRHEADAYTGQKVIIAQLKQLLIEYQRQQALYELSIHFRQLAARQSVNMRKGVWLVRESRGNPLSSFSEEQKLNHRMQSDDQGVIHPAPKVNCRDESGNRP